MLRRTAAETGGRLFEFELQLGPRGKVPAAHLHPEQQERFTVLEGTVQFKVSGRSVLATPGQVVTVPAGSSHSFANLHDRPARVLVEVRPALAMESLLETAAALGARPRPLDLVLFLAEFAREVRPPVVPRVTGALARASARAATTLGLGRRYRGLRAPDRSP